MLFSHLGSKRPGILRRNVVASLVLAFLVGGILAIYVPHIRINEHGNNARAKSSNNIKQLALALQIYESGYGHLPPLMGGGAGYPAFPNDYVIAGGSTKFANVHGPVHMFLLPFMEQDMLCKSMLVDDIDGLVYSAGAKVAHSSSFDGTKGFAYEANVPQLISPSDPSHSAGRNSKNWGTTSYAANAQLFASTNKQGLIAGELTGTSNQFDRALEIAKIPDGSSNTIAFAEKYGQCGNGGSLWSAGIADKPIHAVPANIVEDPFQWPVFALARDRGSPDRVYGADPSSLANPKETRIFFQSQPNPYTTHKGLADEPDAAGCDAFRASTPYSSGILVAMADGSVRTVTKTVDPQVWFYALHPDDGHALELDK